MVGCQPSATPAGHVVIVAGPLDADSADNGATHIAHIASKR